MFNIISREMQIITTLKTIFTYQIGKILLKREILCLRLGLLPITGWSINWSTPTESNLIIRHDKIRCPWLSMSNLKVAVILQTSFHTCEVVQATHCSFFMVNVVWKLPKCLSDWALPWATFLSRPLYLISPVGHTSCMLSPLAPYIHFGSMRKFLIVTNLCFLEAEYHHHGMHLKEEGECKILSDDLKLLVHFFMHWFLNFIDLSIFGCVGCSLLLGPFPRWGESGFRAFSCCWALPSEVVDPRL